MQALPPSVANASREDLQRMLMDSLRKRKASDKRIADLIAEKENLLAAQAAKSGVLTENGGLELQQGQQVGPYSSSTRALALTGA